MIPTNLNKEYPDELINTKLLPNPFDKTKKSILFANYNSNKRSKIISPALVEAAAAAESASSSTSSRIEARVQTTATATATAPSIEASLLKKYKQKKCPHMRRKTRCKECNGDGFRGGFCSHGKLKYNCKECKGSGICEHFKDKYKCKICIDKRINKSLLPTSSKLFASSQLPEISDSLTNITPNTRKSFLSLFSDLGAFFTTESPNRQKSFL